MWPQEGYSACFARPSSNQTSIESPVREMQPLCSAFHRACLHTHRLFVCLRLAQPVCRAWAPSVSACLQSVCAVCLSLSAERVRRVSQPVCGACAPCVSACLRSVCAVCLSLSVERVRRVSQPVCRACAPCVSACLRSVCAVCLSLSVERGRRVSQPVCRACAPCVSACLRSSVSMPSPGGGKVHVIPHTAPGVVVMVTHCLLLPRCM